MNESSGHGDRKGIKRHSESDRTPEFIALRNELQSEIADAAEYVVDRLPPGWHVRKDKDTGQLDLTRRLPNDDGDVSIFYDGMVATAGVDSTFTDVVAKFRVDREPANDKDQEIDTFAIEVRADGSVYSVFEGQAAHGNTQSVRKELHSVDQLELAKGVLDAELAELDIVH